MVARIHLENIALHAPSGAGASALSASTELLLPPAAARHVQVLRLQPRSALILFDGHGGQWDAEVLRMGRSEVAVRLLRFDAVEREAPLALELAVCMPANDRMDDLVEKATELGVTLIRPLMSERSVLRLQGERAQRKQQHWQAVAVAACEQCGRNRVPQVLEPQTLNAWLQALGGVPPSSSEARWLLSLDAAAQPIQAALEQGTLSTVGPLTMLSGPEGGLSPSEVAQARAAGFKPVSLGPRTLRADTAALAASAAVVAWAERLSGQAMPCAAGPAAVSPRP